MPILKARGKASFFLLIVFFSIRLKNENYNEKKLPNFVLYRIRMQKNRLWQYFLKCQKI